MEANPSFESVKKVFLQAWRNQAEDVDGIEDNYISQLVRDTDLSRNRVQRAVDGIEELGLATTFSEKGKRKMNILVNPEFDEV